MDAARAAAASSQRAAAVAERDLRDARAMTPLVRRMARQISELPDDEWAARVWSAMQAGAAKR